MQWPGVVKLVRADATERKCMMDNSSTNGSTDKLFQLVISAAVIGLASACTSGTAAISNTPSPPVESARPSTPSRPVVRSVGGGVCGKTDGKTRGEIIKLFPVAGGENGKAHARGGTLQVWRSTRCRTVWVKLVKLPKYTRKTLEGSVSLDAPTMANPAVHKFVDTFFCGCFVFFVVVLCVFLFFVVLV